MGSSCLRFFSQVFACVSLSVGMDSSWQYALAIWEHCVATGDKGIFGGSLYTTWKPDKNYLKVKCVISSPLYNSNKWDSSLFEQLYHFPNRCDESHLQLNRLQILYFSYKMGGSQPE